MRAYTITRRNEEYKVRFIIEPVSAIVENKQTVVCTTEYEANIIAICLKDEGGKPNIKLRNKGEWEVGCEEFAFFTGNADGKRYIRVCEIIEESWTCTKRDSL